MKLFVGLGNPGREHEGQRHNIGFMAVDAIAAEHGFGPWRAKFQGRLAEGRLGSAKVLLLKPVTYMNRSGQSVGEAMRFFKLGPEDVTVFHDELDLAPGKCRVKMGGGHAGHNGLRSIHSAIGEGYARVRLGIGHPGDKAKVAGYVLHDFSRAETDWVERLTVAIARAAPMLAAGDDARFASAVAEAMNPQRPSPKAAAPGADGVTKEPETKAEKRPDASPFSMLSRILAKKPPSSGSK